MSAHDADGLRLADLFNELLELPSTERSARLEALPADQAELRRELASLLAAATRHANVLGLVGPTRPATMRVAGRYQLERKVGEGGMGEVYLAHDEQLQRPVAIKLLHARFYGAEAMARVAAEARAAARLDHPHVATVYDAGNDGDLAFIAMAYYAGGTLHARLGRGALPLADALLIAEQLADALSAAHAAGIVHRDLKPGNVLFDGEGVAKLADFGVAKLASAVQQEEPAVGTAGYMAPEQARGEAVDGRADLWSLGVLLHEMICGRRLFPDPPAVALPRLAALESVELDAGIPGDVATFLRGLLEPRRSRRLTTAADARNALRALRMAREGRLYARPQRAVHAPQPLTSFVGREQELAQARALLRRVRLLTLTGAGGTGKTRLALHLLHERSADASAGALGGACFVPLGSERHADDVPRAVARALGVREHVAETPVRQVAALIGEANFLLVLDNFEHVLAAAPAVAEWLDLCPHLVVLATSREPLRLQGEHTLGVPPLSLAPPGDPSDMALVETSEAVRLFVERARAVRPDFALSPESVAFISSICQRLDGIPLAIELAAARARLLSPRAILARLDEALDFLRSDTVDRPERHRTLREVIDWSHALLTDEERLLYRRLAVFSGGHTIEAAREVGAVSSAARTLDILGSLCDKNLLRQDEGTDGEPRFSMLETLRDHALEQLRGAGLERETRRAHRHYFLALAERAEVQLRGPAQGNWLDRLDRERQNLAAALEDAFDDTAGNGVLHAARLAASLHRFWLTRGYLREGMAHVQRALREAGGAGASLPPVARGRLHTAAGVLAGEAGTFLDGRTHFEQALAAFREAGDLSAMAATLNHLTWNAWITGDPSEAEQLGREALDMQVAIGHPLGIAVARNNLGWIALHRGAWAEAEDHFRAAEALHRSRGDERSIAFMVCNVGFARMRRGDVGEARRLMREALDRISCVRDPVLTADWTSRYALACHLDGDDDMAAPIERDAVAPLRALGLRALLGFALTRLAQVRLDHGDPHGAMSAASEAVLLRDEIGDRVARPEPLLVLAAARSATREPGALALANQAGREAMAVEDRHTLVGVLDLCARVLARESRPHEAATVWGRARLERRLLGARLPARYRRAERELAHTLLQALGARGLATARAGGRRMSPAAALDLALQAVGVG